MRLLSPALFLFATLLSFDVRAQDTVRSRAVLDLGFDSLTELTDRATTGTLADQAQVVGTPQVISSPFWNQQGNAFILDAASKQHVSVPDSADTDRPTGVTVSTFFLSLHPLTDGGFHGLWAKRGDNADPRTNYGINFFPKGDLFQLYIHDGTGYKVAQYGLRDTIGFSKRVHVTATFQVADAPGADADKDVDDVLIRLFVNGRIVKPRNSTAGFVLGNDAWLNNINIARLLNDVPLTIGSSFGSTELTSGVYDEFLLFDKALAPTDVAKLFKELTGATADQIVQQTAKQQRQRAARPVIATVTPRGLQTGGTTRITVTGSMLKDGSLLLGDRLGTVKIVQTAVNRIVADVTLPAELPPGFYPLRAHGSVGLSNAAIVAIDRLPERTLNAGTAAKPAALPAAFSGTLAGTQQAKVWFKGKQGQRVVADVESRRLGSNLEPVVEIKNERGTPLKVEWRKHELHGDTRAETTLPADGLYFAEVHDLSYRAPGNSPLRLRLGDLKVVDRFIPGNSPGTLAVVGTGLPNGLAAQVETAEELRGFKLTGLPPIDGPLPPVNNIAQTAVSETADGKFAPVAARFEATSPWSVVSVSGTISQPKEADDITFQVDAGTRLQFTLQSRSIGSALDGSLRIFNGKQVLAAKNGNGTGADAVVEVTVPKGVKSLRVRVNDFARRGGAGFGYRLLVRKAGRPDFDITASSNVLEIPDNGSAILKLKVTRRAPGYFFGGPIQLSVEKESGLQISPAVLPAENDNRDALVVLTRTRTPTTPVQQISITAQAAGLPHTRKTLRVPAVTAVVASRFSRLVPVSRIPAVAATINLADVPPILNRGLRAELPIRLTWFEIPDAGTVRFKLLTTEQPRDKKPSIRAVPNQFISAGETSIGLKIDVPLDQVEPVIDCVVVGELVDNPFSPVEHARVFSAPIRLHVQHAITVKATNNLTAKVGSSPQMRGTMMRSYGFDEPVIVSLTGLPNGFKANPVTVPVDEVAFAIPITMPPGTKPTDIKAQLVIQSRTGATIRSSLPVALKITP